MSEQEKNESVAGSAETQPTQQPAPVVPEQPTPETQPVPEQTAPVVAQPVEPSPEFGQPAPDSAVASGHNAPDPEPAGGADPDAGADEPNAEERELAGDGEVTEPHPYVPGFGVTGKFQTPGAQDAGDDTDGDRA